MLLLHIHSSYKHARGYRIHFIYELVFDKLIRVPSSEIINDIEELKTSDAYLTQLITDIHNIQKLAPENIIASKIKSKMYYDRKILNIFKSTTNFFYYVNPRKANSVINTPSFTQYWIYYLMVIYNLL